MKPIELHTDEDRRLEGRLPAVEGQERLPYSVKILP